MGLPIGISNNVLCKFRSVEWSVYFVPLLKYDNPHFIKKDHVHVNNFGLSCHLH